jgi:predicted glycosyltransferase
VNGSHPGRRRLLIYSQDGLGLGHLRRTTLLASAFLTACPAGAVLTVCDSPTGHFFGTGPGHDYLKLPSIRKVRPGEWSPISLRLPFSDVLEMRKAIIRTAALAFEPDVLLVDHMPHGSMGELVPTLEALAGAPVKKILGLRDILDSPETIGRRWRLEGAFEAVERHFDEVLVYGSREVFDVASSYGWPAHLEDRLHYCGYVCAPTAWSPDDTVRIRQSHGVTAGTKLIVAMAGGGADAFPLFETLVLSMPTVRSQLDCRLLLVAGPFLPPDQQAALRRLADGLPIDVVSTVSDSLGVMAAADLLVTMAGYNTTAELLRVGTPALLVPRPGPSAEQQMRASRLARRGWVQWLPPAELSPLALAAAVLSGLNSPGSRRVRPPDLQGLQRAAQHLVGDGLQEGAAEDKSASPAPDDGVVQRAASVGSTSVITDAR